VKNTPCKEITMKKPTLSEESAVEQAGITVNKYLDNAVWYIDRKFGEGYALEHPDLVASLVEAQGHDFATTMRTVTQYELAEATSSIAESLNKNAEALTEIARSLGSLEHLEFLEHLRYIDNVADGVKELARKD
jgi:acyl-CoA reductase-like NAD-dependent aldehyde dehydrogenase